MKKLWVFLGLGSLLVASLACQTLLPSTPKAGGQSESLCREVVSGLVGLTANLEVPQYFQTENPVKQGGEFDPNRYLEVLPHLKLREGWTLDYVYAYQGLGGLPLLYARPVSQTPYLTEQEYAAGQPANFLSALVAEATPEAFLELALVSELGPQFYLFWHAGYNDDQVLCGAPEIEQVIAAHTEGGFGDPFDFNQKRQARALAEPAPQVEITADQVTVSLLMFTNWGGFYRRTFILRRAFPHEILEVRDEPLLPYDCGILF